MDELLVALFGSDARAREGARLLAASHAEGSLSVYALAIIARAPNRVGLKVSQPVPRGKSAAAPAVAAAVGVLVSLLGGPVPAVLRTIRSGLVSTVSEIHRAGLNARFLEQISHDLQPGGAAIIAEVEEDQPSMLDTEIAILGGHAFRHHLEGTLAVVKIEHEVAVLRSEVEKLRAQLRGGQDNDTLKQLSRDRDLELQQARRRAGALAGALRREGLAKVDVLRAQMARLDGGTRTIIEQRATTVRASFEARASSLDQVAEHG
ncbi:hypothetical protein [Teichococcus oryzae]|uniref:Uncharacterized protein n=1 Tax=Teichococcus oryzae TaxID=1608942 RepID=A0A5B2TGA1_9PROT|nr:hypothetical protein [Pseudoroseomonas oryzae]KAA2212830.1 hypothetical protein F0Q34_11895 [Pseudoroseomonas oryzae]